jgi:phosphate transport system permease protein
MSAAAPPEHEIDLPQLEKTLRSSRNLFSYFMSVATGALALLALVPLFSVLLMLVVEGGSKLSVALFTELPPAAGMSGGGIGNALVGTLLIVAIATAISVPVGILGAIYLAEFAPESRTATVVRFAAKVLTGLPSVLAGLFVYVTVVLLTGTFSAPAGGIGLALLMLPIILLTTEDAIRSVPRRMREAAVGMGATQTQTVWYVLLPAALPGILTGVMLAVARAAGETAPLLFTAQFFDFWPTVDPMNPTASMGVLIYDFSNQPFPNQVAIAWAASLVLVVFVLCTNIVGQLWSSRQARK